MANCTVFAGCYYDGRPVDCNGNGFAPDVGFYAWEATSNQALPHIAETKVLFDSDKDDPGNDFSTVTSVFTAPTKGRYTFSSNVDITVAARSQIDLRIYQNTTKRAESSVETSIAATMSPCVSAVLQLNAGDTVEVRAWQNSGFAATIQIPDRWFMGAQIIEN